MAQVGNVEADAVRELSVRSQDPLCASAALSYLEDDLTPTERFFIRNHFAIPRFERSSWPLTIWGEVERPLMLRSEDLKRLPRKEKVCLLECAGNSRSSMQPPAEGIPWDHGAVGTALSTGAPVAASGQGAISHVEVSADNGRTWYQAALQEPRSLNAWCRLEYQWEVRKPGYYLIRARATDEKGNIQPLQAPWNFRGYAVNSIHTVPVTVRSGDLIAIDSTHLTPNQPA